MPTWGGILTEIQQLLGQGAPNAIDLVRRTYLIRLSQLTGRNTIVYATAFTAPRANTPPQFLSITDEDLQGFMETVYGLQGDGLDLILHSPGGELNATEAIVCYLRSKFKNIRVIVPSLAMSAATMISCSANSIVMGKHSFLGPIDPQITLQTPLGVRMLPAQLVLEQFDKAVKECGDPTKLAAWMPMLHQYGPDLLVQCEMVSQRSQELVERWLATYMFRGKRNRAVHAGKIAEWLATHKNHKAHGRHIPREELLSAKLAISSLEDDQQFQDLVLSVFHATTHLFAMSPVVKLIENHHGRAFMKMSG